jgi:hypothetical protein
VARAPQHLARSPPVAAHRVRRCHGPNLHGIQSQGFGRRRQRVPSRRTAPPPEVVSVRGIRAPGRGSLASRTPSRVPMTNYRATAIAGLRGALLSARSRSQKLCVIGSCSCAPAMT